MIVQVPPPWSPKSRETATLTNVFPSSKVLYLFARIKCDAVACLHTWEFGIMYPCACVCVCVRVRAHLCVFTQKRTVQQFTQTLLEVPKVTVI